MTAEEMGSAAAANDAAYDGRFFYAVQTTKVYCRPSCKSKRPNPENIRFFTTAAEAEAAGFRPCKRCRPDLQEYLPARDYASEMKRIIEAGFLEKTAMFDKLKRLGVSPKRSIEIFKSEFGMTPGEYADELRIREARRRLTETDEPILDIAFSLGFESASAFYALFGKAENVPPAEFRKAAARSLPQGAAYTYPTALGAITIETDGRAVTGLRFGGDASASPLGRNALTDQAAGELQEYFAGRRTAFSVPLRPAGSPFQLRVWEALREIPYGQTRSYSEIAKSIGRPAAARAVGTANRKNPIAVLIPCHRVVGADGSLTGYAAGLKIKQWLLELERNNINRKGR